MLAAPIFFGPLALWPIAAFRQTRILATMKHFGP
jgi:hypothetical protein